MGVSPQKIQGPGTAVKFSEVICWGQARDVPEAVMDKVRVEPTPSR